MYNIGWEIQNNTNNDLQYAPEEAPGTEVFSCSPTKKAINCY